MDLYIAKGLTVTGKNRALQDLGENSDVQVRVDTLDNIATINFFCLKILIIRHRHPHQR